MNLFSFLIGILVAHGSIGSSSCSDDIYCGKAGSYSLFIQEELPGFRLVLGFGMFVMTVSF